MATGLPIEDIMLSIRELRSNEENFNTLYQKLEKTINLAQQAGHHSLADELQETKEKQAAEYSKAKEATGNAWPEFEKFVTQFERSLTTAKTA
jgi:hypothetical protein